jgi:hypothetical protein
LEWLLKTPFEADMEKEEKQARDILPTTGLWSIQDFANYMGISPDSVQEKLTEIGVKTFHFSRRYRHRFFRLEDLK